MKHIAFTAAMIGVIMLTAIGMATRPAEAVVTTTLAVNGSVAIPCTVSTTAVNFPQYVAGQTAALDATPGSVSVTCATSVPYDLTLDGGANWTGTTRQMKDVPSGGFLAYGLFWDNYITAAGDGAAVGAKATGTGAGAGAPQAHAIYGRIPGGQNAAVGAAYNDTVNVTVAY